MFLHRSPALHSDSILWRMCHACQGPVASVAREAMSCRERYLSREKMDGLLPLVSMPAERSGALLGDGRGRTC